MRRRIIPIICIVWFVACAALYLFLAQRIDSTRGYTSFHSWATDDEYIYVSDNIPSGGIIYQYGGTDEQKAKALARNGKGLSLPVRKILTAKGHPDLDGYSIYKLAFSAEELYALAGKNEIRNKQNVMIYRIFAMDKDLQTTKASGKFALPDGQKLSSLDMDEKTAFVTTLTADGQTANTYQIDPEDFESLMEEPSTQAEGGISLSFNKNSSLFFNINNDTAEKSTEPKEEPLMDLKNIKRRTVEAGRYFSQAMYESGVIYTRYDNSEPNERFLTPANIIEIYNNSGLTFLQRIAVSNVNMLVFVLIIVIGLVVIISFPFLFRRRKRIVYMALIAEVLLAAAVVVSFLFIAMQRKNVREDVLDTQVAYNVAGIANSLELPLFNNLDGENGGTAFYDSATYLQLQRAIAEKLSLTQAGAGIYDICYVDLGTGKDYISGSGKNRQQISALYGPVTKAVMEEVRSTPNAVVRTQWIQGKKYRVIGVHSQGSGDPGLGVIALADYEVTTGSFWEDNLKVLIFAILVFFAGSMAILIYLVLQSADLRRLGDGLQRLASGEENIEKPKVLGRDLSRMWNSIYEIDKNVRATNRARFQIFEAYYRFAPKKIEKILLKDSITEVQSGDVVEMQGTMALLSTTGQRNTNRLDIERMNHFLSMIEKNQERRDGIYVSNNGDLSKLKVLFIDSLETISFGIELLYELREWQQKEFAGAAILLHYAPFIYGIAGTKAQSAAFLASRETEVLEGYIDWFRSIHIPLIITNTVKEREDRLVDLRYIGFIMSRSQTEGRIELYEVLDANSGRIRQLKLRFRDQFEEAIKLFYRQDFYLARNAFTEILKDFPEDEIVTWYLFECEYYLNSNADTSGFTGALHLDKHKKVLENRIYN